MVGGLLFRRLKFAHVEGLAVLVALSWSFHTVGWLRVLSASIAAIGFVSILTFPYARAASVALVVTALATALWLQWRRVGVRIAAAAKRGERQGQPPSRRPRSEIGRAHV